MNWTKPLKTFKNTFHSVARKASRASMITLRQRPADALIVACPLLCQIISF